MTGLVLSKSHTNSAPLATLLAGVPALWEAWKGGVRASVPFCTVQGIGTSLGFWGAICAADKATAQSVQVMHSGATGKGTFAGNGIYLDHPRPAISTHSPRSSRAGPHAPVNRPTSG